MKISDHAKGLLLTICGVLILSPDALMVRLIQSDIWTLMFWRSLLTALMMCVFLLIRYRSRFLHSFWATGRAGLLSALAITAGSFLFVGALKQTSAANTLIILAAAPVISSLLGWLFLKEKLPWYTWIAIFSCFLGILFIFSGSLHSGLLLGDLLALGATTMWGSNIVIIRSGRKVNMIPANVLGNLCVPLLVLLLGANPFQVAAPDAGLLLLLGGGLLPLAFGLITLGPRYLKAAEVSLILLAESVLGPLWVWLVLAEVPHLRTLVAGLLIIGTLIIHTLIATRRDKPLKDSAPA